jgi:SAM-dependent methyltransferase
MLIINETCNICKSTDWHDLDYLRNWQVWYDTEKRNEGEPVGFKICKSCGFITYDYLDQERLNHLYYLERPAVRSMNVITSNRKNEYHKAFFYKSPEFREKIMQDNCTIIDVGCAQGAMLDMIHNYYDVDKKNLYGIEINKPYVAFARGEYGLTVSEQWPEDVAFDIISYYHVLEHLQYPEKALQEAKERLKDNGIMYISVPYWLDILQNFDGSMAIDYENTYHLNHINVFTVNSFKNLLNISGLEIIQEDYDYYAYTVMVKKGETRPIQTEDWQFNVKRLETEKTAMQLVNSQKYDEALQLVPKYPDAYIMKSLYKDNIKSFDVQVKILTEGLKHTPNDSKLIMQLAKVYFQWDESKSGEALIMTNNVLQAEKYFKRCLELKPGNEDSLYFLAIIAARYRKEYGKACELLNDVIKINPTRYAETIDLKGNFRREQAKIN